MWALCVFWIGFAFIYFHSILIAKNEPGELSRSIELPILTASGGLWFGLDPNGLRTKCIYHIQVKTMALAIMK